MLDHVNIFSSVFSSFHPTQHENQVCKWSRSVQPLNWVWLFVTPWTAPLQASLSITHSRYLLKVISSESVMPSNHLILCCPLPLLPSIFPIIRVFSNESVLHMWWPKYWNFSFCISPSNEYSMNNDKHVLNAYYIAGTILNILPLFFHSMFTNPGRGYELASSQFQRAIAEGHAVYKYY